ncbi:VOC family protein [Novipirellula artificiosorum]|uniref:Glyoxalase-like domain protein n=1 Tax=Novipirellula artificiosorum TaxID=2528016 RepID=A0A5C6D683_9BACT|nr:VOC family protein [Novipirellula artificiosorum]TWU31217.1 Glyoxalase-like domain protein [Novipirellula artificiosorum]
MRMKSLAVASILTAILPNLLFAQHLKEELSPARFEHVRINVADKEATAKWYVDNVGLEIIATNDSDVVFVADKDHNFMIELCSIPGLKNTYFDVDLNSYHLAFEGHKTIEAVAEKMLKNGAEQVGDIYRNQVGDFVLNLRDPNGFAAQLIHRVDAFFPKPVKSTIRFEHFAFNTEDQKISALWFVQFMDLTIPWSKDIDVAQNDFRNYRVPYIGDVDNRMSLELYTKDIDCALNNMPHEVVHVAFTTLEPQRLAKRMVHGGGKQVGEARVEANGDVVVDLYDPRGVPIRLIKRKNRIL